jgi:hypothetical protein
LNLDPGESEAMALYWETAADYLLIDEKKGRTIAARNGRHNWDSFISKAERFSLYGEAFS